MLFHRNIYLCRRFAAAGFGCGRPWTSAPRRRRLCLPRSRQVQNWVRAVRLLLMRRRKRPARRRRRGLVSETERWYNFSVLCVKELAAEQHWKLWLLLQLLLIVVVKAKARDSHIAHLTGKADQLRFYDHWKWQLLLLLLLWTNMIKVS